MSAVMQAPAQTLTITKVKEHIGAIVTGIDLAQPIDAVTRKKLYDAVVENVVLVIRGQAHLTPAQLSAIVDHELTPQIDYNERSALQIDTLDRRLARFGMGLFVATLVSSVIVIFGLVYDPDWVENTNDWFTLLSAGFPAVGTAIFGSRP